MNDRRNVNGTLFERGAREAVPAPPRAGRGRSTEATTDVRRGRAIAAAAGSACALTAVVALAAPPAGGFSPGRAITPPHAQAGLQCKSCHGETGEGTAAFRAAARGACVGCHGPHASTRSGHARLAGSGELGCTTCHAIHTPLQGGVAFDPDGQAHRYTTGLDVKVPGVVHATGRKVRVPAVPLAICANCHDPWNPKDATARCADGSGFSACFDEHQAALPPDASDVAPAAPSRRNGRSDVRREDARRNERGPGGLGGPSGAGGKFGAPGAVCAAQHQPDRAFSQDAAREVIHRLPDPRGDLRASLAGAGQPALWLGAGGAGAVFGWAAVAAADALRSRRRRRAATDAKAAAPTAAATRKRLPTVDTTTCLGCYACVDACPYGVLEIERYVAVVARPEACCGLVLCEQVCPNGSLQVVEGEPDEERLRLAETNESLDVEGLFLAGDVTGVPLIKNAIAQGTRVAEAVSKSLEGAPADPRAVDVAIVGAGPAGLAAALRVQELLGRSFTIVDQGTVAHAIRSFPRDKLVFDQPLELPVVGKLWLRESTKEELLGHWLRLVRREGLEVREHQRLAGIERRGTAFQLDLVPGDASSEARVPSILARRVIVAIGRRGTPRKLPVPVPPELEADVFYHLADARSFEGKRILVVGLGDVAMENAMALARQTGTSVTILHRGATYTRGQKRNIDAVERLRRGGRLDLIFDAEVAGLRTSRSAGRGSSRGVATVRTKSGSREIPFDACFVLVGSIPPRDLLARLGLREAHAPAPRFDVFAGSRPAVTGEGPT